MMLNIKKNTSKNIVVFVNSHKNKLISPSLDN